MKTHFPEMMIEKNPEDMSMFVGKEIDMLHQTISRDIFILKIPKLGKIIVHTLPHLSSVCMVQALHTI